MGNNRMAKGQRLALLVILLILLFVYLSMRSSEFFIGSAIPESCGTAGVRPSDATFSLLKSITNGKEDPSAKRQYTKSECNKLKDGVYLGGNCYQLKDKPVKDGSPNLTSSNIILDYGQVCGGLNQSTTVTPAPTECMIDGVHAGKPNVAFSTTMFGKKVSMEDNALRLYTENECTLLNGKFEKLGETLKRSGTTSDEQAKAEHLNGKDMGFCNSEYNFSIMCTINAAASPGAQVADASKKALTSWLNS